MILLHHVVQVFALSQFAPSPDSAVLLQLVDRRRVGSVLIQVDHLRCRITGICQSPLKEAFSGCRGALGGPRKIDGLAGGIDRPIEKPLLPLHLNVGLIHPTAPIGWFQMWPPNATHNWRWRPNLFPGSPPQSVPQRWVAEIPAPTHNMMMWPGYCRHLNGLVAVMGRSRPSRSRPRDGATP